MNEARREPQQGRSRATVETILLAAARVLEAEGLESASTNRVAEAAGVSVGSLYQYFGNKDALVRDLFVRHAHDILAQLESSLAPVTNPDARKKPVPFATLAREVVQALVEVNRINPRVHRLFIEHAARLGLEAQLAEVVHRSEALVKACLDARDDLRKVDTALASFILVSSVDAAIHAALQRRPALLGERRFTTELSELVTRYLQKAGPEAAAPAPTAAPAAKKRAKK